jgi:hypothetical protein
MDFRTSNFVRRIALIVLLGAINVSAQEPAAQAPPSDNQAISSAPDSRANRHLAEHRFWDKENRWLFAGVGAARTLDYFSTLNMRKRGRQEILLSNDAVDSHAAFAAIEAAGTSVSIGASFLFHHYGHHKLERWTSFVHIGVATTGAVRNYCLTTAHRKTGPQSASLPITRNVLPNLSVQPKR